MKGLAMQNANKLEILGNVFNSKGTSLDHVNQRAAKCRQSFYSLSPVGMLYPGVSPDTQIHLFNSICQPTLVYGSDCMNIRDSDKVKLNSNQCKLIKRSLGLSKYSHNTVILQALGVANVKDIIDRNVCSLFHRIFRVTSMAREICTYNLAFYLLYGQVTRGSLVERVLSSYSSPVSLVFKPPVITDQCLIPDGHVDSVKMLLNSENFMKPHSDEHMLVHLLTTPF